MADLCSAETCDCQCHSNDGITDEDGNLLKCNWDECNCYCHECCNCGTTKNMWWDDIGIFANWSLYPNKMYGGALCVPCVTRSGWVGER